MSTTKTTTIRWHEVCDGATSVGTVPLSPTVVKNLADEGETAAQEGLAAFTAWLVGLGQPWCENSLDGPVRPPEESRASAPVAALLERWGFDVRLLGRRAERANLLARRRFGPGPTLMLNDHLDTYPSGPASRWRRCEHPYRLARHGDELVARGTSDTRANMAALLWAARAVVEDPPDAGELWVALTVDEERNGVEGASYLMDVLGLRPDASITVEPTAALDAATPTIGLATRQTGHALLDVTVTGVSSHIWRPDTGANPASALLRVIADLEDPERAGHRICLVGLDAGEAGMAQFTPLRASARVAVVGIADDVSRGDVRRELEYVAARRCADVFDVDVDFVNGPTFVPGTRELSAEDPVVDAVSAAYREVAGVDVERYCKPAFNDTIVFRHAGVSAVTFGPGFEGWPVYDEVISLKTMEFSVEVLERAVRRFLDV